MTWTCPVCGYDGLPDEPWSKDGGSDEICPSCGIQFGYDDAAGGDFAARKLEWQAWRQKWINNGMKWNSACPPPTGWNPIEQLKNIGVEGRAADTGSDGAGTTAV